MTRKRDDPATGHDGPDHTTDGLTKREHAAIQFASTHWDWVSWESPDPGSKYIARSAVEMADALFDELERDDNER